MSKPLSLVSNREGAWAVFAIACGFVFFKYVLEISPSIMVHELMHAFSLDGLEIGHLAASYFYAYFFMQIPVGILVDKFNTRNIITTAILICSIGACIFSQASSFPMAILGRIIIGVGAAFSMVGTLKLVTLWFAPKNFALVSSLMMTMAMLGSICGQAPLAHLVDHYHWRNSMLILSVCGVGLAICFWLVLKFRARADRVSELAADGAEGAVEGADEQLGVWKLLLGVVKNKQSWLVSMYSGLAFAPVTAFAGLWGTPFLMEFHHLDKATVAGVMSFIFIGFAVGAPVSGWLSSGEGKFKLSFKRIMFCGTLIELLSLVFVLYSSSLSILELRFVMFIFGFFTGFFFVSFAYMQLINSKQASGTAIGFMNMFNALFGALCDPLIGYLLDSGWGHKMEGGVRFFSVANYQFALTSLVFGLVLALFILFFIKNRHSE